MTDKTLTHEQLLKIQEELSAYVKEREQAVFHFKTHANHQWMNGYQAGCREEVLSLKKFLLKIQQL